MGGAGGAGGGGVAGRAGGAGAAGKVGRVGGAGGGGAGQAGRVGRVGRLGAKCNKTSLQTWLHKCVAGSKHRRWCISEGRISHTFVGRLMFGARQSVTARECYVRDPTLLIVNHRLCCNSRCTTTQTRQSPAIGDNLNCQSSLVGPLWPTRWVTWPLSQKNMS